MWNTDAGAGHLQDKLREARGTWRPGDEFLKMQSVRLNVLTGIRSAGGWFEYRGGCTGRG